jgi:ATP-dependent DNA ligase
MRLRRAADLASLETVYGAKDLTVEEKYDGFKLLVTTTKAGKVRMYTRRGQDVTRRLPEFANKLERHLDRGDAILGEIVYQIGDEQSLRAVQSIVGSKDPRRATQRAKELGGKLVFYAYDILMDGGESIVSKPLSIRRKILRSKIPARGDVRRARVYPWAQRDRAIKNALKSGGEGLVIKPKSSAYLWRPKGQLEPWGDWYKFKAGLKYKTDDVILTSYTKGKEKLIFRAEQFDRAGKKRIFVGKLSGLDKATERKIAKKIDKGQEVLVEVSFQERYPSGKMRHMGWVRERLDKPPQSATFDRAKETSQIRKRLR